MTMSLEKIAYPPGSFLFLTLVAFLASLFIQLVNKRTIDYEKVRRANKIQREYVDLQKEFARTRDKKIQKKMLKMKPGMDMARSEASSMSMKPMLFTIIPMMVVWQILRPVFTDLPVLRMPFNLFNLPLIGIFRRGSVLAANVLGYLSYYMLISYLFTFILQRLLGTTISAVD